MDQFKITVDLLIIQEIYIGPIERSIIFENLSQESWFEYKVLLFLNNFQKKEQLINEI